jgi:iron complex transport system ATP-binding protein
MVIKVKDVHFSYPSRKGVLEGVTFEVRRGECVALLGVNGAGKSTLLRCMNSILSPTKGAVFVGGEDISEWSRNQIARRIGYVPQRSHDSELTVFEMVALGRKPYINWFLRERDYEIVDDIMAVLGLKDFAMKRVSELSGGELQKVMIARALAQTPDVLLLDEPTSHLDMKNQLEVMRVIRDLTKKRKPSVSTIVCLHDVNLALRFADRLIFLKDGIIWAVTTPEGLDPEIVRDVYGVRVQIVRVGRHIVVIPVDDEEGEYHEESDHLVADMSFYRGRVAERCL